MTGRGIETAPHPPRLLVHHIGTASVCRPCEAIQVISSFSIVSAMDAVNSLTSNQCPRPGHVRRGPMPTNISDLLLLARHVNIVHHIPGRIRLRVTPSGVALACGVNLNQLIDCIPGVLGIRVNALVGSIVIEYDPDRLSPDLWESLVRSNGDPESASEIKGRLVMIWKG